MGRWYISCFQYVLYLMHENTKQELKKTVRFQHRKRVVLRTNPNTPVQYSISKHSCMLLSST